MTRKLKHFKKGRFHQGEAAFKFIPCNENGYQKTMTLEELLPESFGPENL